MIEIYNKNGFELFECLSDKSPANENIRDAILTVERAKTLQGQGKLIGAIIPDDVIVININRDDEIDGFNEFVKIKNEWKIDFNFMEQTLAANTANNGFHIFFKKPKGIDFDDGMKAPGVDLKVNGYVIAAGNSGYKLFNQLPIKEIDKNVLNWLSNSKSIKQEIKVKDPLPLKIFKSILKKIETESIKDFDKFIQSALITAGNSKGVIDFLSSWSYQYWSISKDEAADKIRQMKIEDGITVHTFVTILKDSNLSNHMISKIAIHQSIARSIAENMAYELSLPFKMPNLEELCRLPFVHDFFQNQGHTQASEILSYCLKTKVLYSDGDASFFFFGGSRWESLPGIYDISYTILSTVARVFWQMNASDQTIADEKMYYDVNKAISSTAWKDRVIKDFKTKPNIYKKEVGWDSVELRETITTFDGVIEFSGGEIKSRNGRFDEYRLTYVEYTNDEILSSSTPKKFIKFLSEIFPDKDTLLTAKYVLSLCISGNAMRRNFHLWEGAGANGKSTLIRILQDALGPEKTTTYPSKLLLPNMMERNMGTTAELDTFRGKYAAFANEVESGKRFSNGIIKQLTGGDPISVNPKYKSGYTMKATWQLILAVNDMPGFDVADTAFIDRLCVLPFSVTFCKTEEARESLIKRGEKPEFLKVAGDGVKIHNELLGEKIAIIKYMIDSYVELEKDYDGVIPQSGQCIAKKDHYIVENDDYTEFIENCCVMGEGFKISNNDLTVAFREYVNNDKIKTNTITKSILLKFERFGVERCQMIADNGKRCRGLSGVRLKLKDDDAEQPF